MNRIIEGDASDAARRGELARETVRALSTDDLLDLLDAARVELCSRAISGDEEAARAMKEGKS